MRILDPTYKHKCFGLASEEADELFFTVNNKHIPFIILDTGIWFLNYHLAEAKGKALKDYTQNWRRNTKYLRGREMKVDTKEALYVIRDAYKSQTSISINQGRCVLLDAERAYHYLFYEAVRHREYVDTVNEIVLKGDELRVELFHITNQLNIEEKSAQRTISKYIDKFERLGPLIKIKGKSSTTYFLNESQAFLLGAILKNTEEVLEFKVWLIDTFSKARRKALSKSEEDILERDIHKQIVELASYTSLKFRSEVPIQDRRVDLLVSDSIAIELKREKVTVAIITDLIAKRGYLNKLRNQYTTFKILLVCSPAGITEDASYMLEAMYPYVQFVTPRKVGDSLAELALKEYPSCSHWWLYKFIFTKFSNILSPRFLDPFKVQNTAKVLTPSK